jgi:hypothetical protein
MKLWAKIRKRGKEAETIFINNCKKNKVLCVKTNDLIYLLLEKRNRTGLNFHASKEYRNDVKRIAKYLSKKLKKFLIGLAKKKANPVYRYLYSYPSSKSKTRIAWCDYHWILPGIPDFIVYNRTSKEVYFTEIKASNPKLNPNQTGMIRNLKKKGFKVFICCPKRDIYEKA